MNTDEIIARMGDRVCDRELGLPEGTLERAAEMIGDEYDDAAIHDMPEKEWLRVVENAIERAGI